MALVNPQIAMSFRPTTEYQPRNALAEYAQIQNIIGGQRQAEVAEMQLDQLRQDRDALRQIQAAIVEKGGPPDLNAAADAMIRSGRPQYIQQGLTIRDTLRKQKLLENYEREYYPTDAATPSAVPAAAAAAPAAAAPSAAAAAPAEGAVNALAPAAATAAPATTNAMRAAAQPDVNALMTQYRRAAAAGSPDAPAILKQIEAALRGDQSTKVSPGEVVINRSGQVIYTAPAAPSAIGAIEAEIATLKGQGVADTDPRIVARQNKIRQLSGAPGPTEIANIEAEIATLKGQGVADTDPRIVARQGKIRQLSGAPGPTEIANVEAEVAALRAQGVPDTDPRITARVNKIRQLSGAPGPTEFAVLETEIAALKAQGVADTDPRIVTRRGKIEQLSSGANPAMVAEYKFAQTPAGGNFQGTFQQFVTARAAAGRAPVQPVAPTITTVEDPTSPGKFLQVDARVYRGGGRGSPGVIGVARPSAATEKAATQRAQLSRDLDSAIRELAEITKDGGLIDQSTGSGAGRLVDIGARFVGKATPGDIAIGKIAPIADLALKMVPRFEGPQSDKDTQSYKEAAGQLADATLPTAIRKEAGKTVLRLMRERKGQFVTSDMAAEGAPAADGGVDTSNPLLR